MNLIIWHGYLLAGTGSNIYTQQIARAWGNLGHTVRVLCQEPHPERYPMGGRVRVMRPEIGPLLPVFVLDRYHGVEPRHVAEFDPAELAAYVEANAAALRSELQREPADLVLANHAIMGGPVAAAGCGPTSTPFAVKVHGSELEYAIRPYPRLAAPARQALDRAAAVFVGSAHIEEVTRELLGAGPYQRRVRIVPPGVDVEAFRPGGGSLPALQELLRGHVAGSHPERSPDPDAAERLAGLGGFVLYFGKLIRQKGVGVLLEAWSRLAPGHPDLTLIVVGFGGDRAALEEEAGPRVVFTGAMDHDQLQLLVPLAEAVVVPSVMHEAFGMVAAEAAACGVLPVVTGHSGLAEVAAGLGEAGRTFDGSAADLARVLGGVLDLPVAERRRLGALARAAVLERWSWEGIGRRLLAEIPVPKQVAPPANA